MLADWSEQRLPLGLRWRSSDAFIITSVAVAIFTDTFLYGVLIPVFPSVLHYRCSVPDEKVQLFTSLAVGLSGAGNLIGACLFGYLADHIRNRRASLLLGLAVFISATVTLWAAHHVALMCVGRFFQGFASAAVWSVGLALLADTVGRAEVPVAMGYVNIGFSCGTFVGPIVGGILYSVASFDTVMITAVGLLLLDVLLRLLLIEKKEVAAMLAGIENSGPNDDDGDPAGSSTTPDVTTPLLREREQRLPRQADGPPYSTESMDPALQEQPETETETSSRARLEPAYRTLIGSPKLLVSLICAFVQAMTMSSFEVTLPIHLEHEAGYEPFNTSLVFIPLMLPAFLSPVIGRVCEMIGNRPVASAGYIVCGAVLVALRFHNSADSLQEVGLFVGLGLIGIAMCMIMTPVLSDIFDVVEDLEREKPGCFGPYGAFAQAYGLFEFAYAGGTLLGPMLAGWLNTQFGWPGLTLCLGIANILTTGLMVKM